MFSGCLPVRFLSTQIKLHGGIIVDALSKHISSLEAHSIVINIQFHLLLFKGFQDLKDFYDRRTYRS